MRYMIYSATSVQKHGSAWVTVQMSRQSSDFSKLRAELARARSVVVLTGAGVSAESGVPTFRGAGGLWRTHSAAALATPGAFRASPALVWEFYHYRRETAAAAQPNACHRAIAAYESRNEDRQRVTVITQNVDGLHARAGSRNLLELHGNLFRTRCTKCKDVRDNTDSPICEALRGRGAPDVAARGSDVPVERLPHCARTGCGALLRPHIVWFGENLDSAVLERAQAAVESCDVCLVVGTSSLVHPAALLAPAAAARGAVVAEFNMEATPATRQCAYHFSGPCGVTIPQALDP